MNRSGSNRFLIFVIDEPHFYCGVFLLLKFYLYLKEIFKKMAKKSKQASKVLQLMDMDFTYQQALKIVLSQDKRLSKKKLVSELDKYI